MVLCRLMVTCTEIISYKYICLGVLIHVYVWILLTSPYYIFYCYFWQWCVLNKWIYLLVLPAKMGLFSSIHSHLPVFSVSSLSQRTVLFISWISQVNMVWKRKKRTFFKENSNRILQEKLLTNTHWQIIALKNHKCYQSISTHCFLNFLCTFISLQDCFQSTAKNEWHD